MLIHGELEYKTVSMEGLNAMKHNAEISKLTSKGWIINSATPNANDFQMEYYLKRPIQ